MTTHVELAIVNQRSSLEIDDVELQAGACGWLCDALAFAGRNPQCLLVAEEGLARFPRRIPADQWVTPFSPYAMMALWRACSLQWMGRLPESLEAFAEHRRVSEEDGTLEFVGYNYFVENQGAFLALDAERTLANAQRHVELSRKLGESPSLVVSSLMSFACAHLAAGRAADAIEALRRALEVYGRMERQVEAQAAAMLAEALLLAGDVSAAQSAAENAIAISCRSERTQWEILAQGVLARALLRANGVAARESAEDALVRGIDEEEVRLRSLEVQQAEATARLGSLRFELARPSRQVEPERRGRRPL